MKKSVLILFAVAALAASCTKEIKPAAPAVDFGKGAEIAFTTRMDAPATRGATEVVTASFTTFNVIATSGTSTQTKIWDDGVFTGTPGGNYTGGKYWPSSSVSWNFYASNAAMTFASSGSTIAVADCNTDLVAEYLEGATYQASNALTFEHILCQLGTVAMKAPDTFTVTDLKVSLLPITSGTYNMKADTWARGSASASPVYVVGTAAEGVAVPAAGYVSADNDLWLVPGSYQLTASYTITKGDFTEIYTKHATVTLQQGKNNNLGLPDTDGDGQNDDPNIPDPGNDIKDIIFTVSVTPWTDVEIPATFS